MILHELLIKNKNKTKNFSTIIQDNNIDIENFKNCTHSIRLSFNQIKIIKFLKTISKLYFKLLGIWLINRFSFKTS